MKLPISPKHFLLEILLASGIAWCFSLFAKDFAFWFIALLLILLGWHHYSEYTLLQLLNPTKKSDKATATIAHISQTVAYHQKRTRKEKIQTLRLLSKLNKNTQYLPDAIIICDQEGRISWCNSIAQELFDFFWDKKSLKSIFNVLFYPEFKAYFQQTNRNRPLVILTHNQRYIEINLHQYDAEYVLLVARDVTTFIRLLHARQTFLANMNHELRTPLTVLQGYLEMLENGGSVELQQKAISAMKSQSQRMTDLLQQLAVLAKIEQSDNQAHQRFDLSKLVQSCVESVNALPHHQQITSDIVPNLSMIGDESQVQSAVSNLIYNAVRHAGENCQIHISLHRTAQGIELNVEDNGIGIETKHIAHLTERFYRVDESRNNKTGGSGLGLAIVKHALEQHNSHLQIQSEVGKGSRFSFVIPQQD